ncbi:putative PPPDE peptidase domain-containing protein [Dioscorea sansibarensis]
MPLNLRGKTAAHFSLFSKVRSAGQTKGSSPVYLNVYDLTPMNGYIYWAGVGIYHSGVEADGYMEWNTHLARMDSTSGVFEVEPRQCPGFRYRMSIFMGTTCLDPIQVRGFMELLSMNYNGDMYHLIAKNCNHFCKDACYKLTGNSIPKWVNRLAGIGAFCSCLLPSALQVTAVNHETDYPVYEGERRKLRSAFSCLSSLSMRQKQFLTASLFLHSPLKGYLAPWELRGLTPFR